MSFALTPHTRDDVVWCFAVAWLALPFGRHLQIFYEDDFAEMKRTPPYVAPDTKTRLCENYY